MKLHKFKWSLPMTIFRKLLWSGAKKKMFHLVTLPLLNFWLPELQNLLLASFASALLSSTFGETNRFCSKTVWYFVKNFCLILFQALDLSSQVLVKSWHINEPHSAILSTNHHPTSTSSLLSPKLIFLTVRRKLPRATPVQQNVSLR